MSEDDEHQSRASTQALRTAQDRRSALETVFRVAQSVERLQAGLQAANMMAGSAFQIPKHVAKFYSGLEKRTRELDNAAVEQMLGELEHQVQAELAQILEMTGTSEGAPLHLPDEGAPEVSTRELEEISELVFGFRRKAQTAVVLRLVLRERGVHTEALELPVDANALQLHIDRLAREEQRCRERLQGDIRTLMSELEQLSRSPELPEALREQLDQSGKELAENLQHLVRGRTLESLPHSFETVTMEEPDQPPPQNPVPPSEPEAPLKPRGALSTCWTWLKTPREVSWSDCRSGRYRGKPRE